MKNTDDKKRLYTLLSLFFSLLIYVGAVALYFYAHGWRIDPIDQMIVKTGVLTVDSDPFLANLYIEGEDEGRTPKSISLPVGKYDISVYRSGYREWKKNIEIKEEKSTPVRAWLIKEDITKTNNYLLQDKEYLNSWIDENKNHLYFLTRYQLSTSEFYRYELYRFDINTAFWDLSSNPKIVLTFDSTTDANISLTLAPNGLLSLLRISNGNITTNYLLDSTQSTNLNSLEELDIRTLANYTMTWSRDSRYLMFESKNDLLSYDVERKTRYLLIKKDENKEYIWSTDEQGFFYEIQEGTENLNTDVYSYLLIQHQMDGSNTKVLVDNLYFQKDGSYLNQYKDDTTLLKYAPFTNSPQSTKSVGKLLSMRINQNAKGIYLQTETSSYWYNIDTKKYHLISAYSSELIKFAPDNYKLIFKDTQGYNVFTFLKEDGDHTVEIGAKVIKGVDTSSTQVNWISDSSYIWYVKDNSMYIADKDGDNTLAILTDIDTLKHFVVTISKEKVFTFYTQDTLTGLQNLLIDTYLLK